MPLPSTHFPERRAWPRQRKQVKVLVADPGDILDDPYPAWVLDRSRGGLCLVVGPMEIEEGTVLGVRPSTLAAAAPYIDVRVKHCRRKDNSVELGCEFVSADCVKMFLQFN